MSAAFCVGRFTRRTRGFLAGCLLAVRLWNYFWWEPFGESFARRCAARCNCLSNHHFSTTSFQKWSPSSHSGTPPPQSSRNKSHLIYFDLSFESPFGWTCSSRNCCCPLRRWPDRLGMVRHGKRTIRGGGL